MRIDSLTPEPNTVGAVSGGNGVGEVKLTRKNMFFRRNQKPHRTEREDDKIWAAKASRLKGIYEEIAQKLKEKCPVLVIAHFEKSMAELRLSLEEKNLKFKMARSDRDLFPLEETKLILLLSENISGPSGVSSSWPGNETLKDGKLHILVVEHHPLAERDQAVISFADHLPWASTVCFHASLDEPLLKMFGAESILGLLKTLGLDESQCMSHSLVTSAIAKAQKKIKKPALGDQRVASMEEWFSYNYPS